MDKIQTRYFRLGDEYDKREELTLEQFERGRTVDVTVLSFDNNNRHIIRCDVYYTPYGGLYLEVTQPLDYALNLFQALLEADQLLYAGKKPVVRNKDE